MHRTGISWVPLVGIGLVVVAAVSVASALAAPSAARPFELVAIDRYVGECPDCFPVTHDATFMSAAPFCESGTIDDVEAPPGTARNSYRRCRCRDGSGSLTLAERAGRASAFGGEWTT